MSEINFEFLNIPIIVMIVYYFIEVLKYTFNYNEKFKRFIPIIASAMGITISILSFYFVPGVIPTDNIAVAIMLGAVSGLSATGANQIFKQLYK